MDSLANPLSLDAMKDHFLLRTLGVVFQSLIVILLTWVIACPLNAQNRLFLGFTKSEAIKSLALTKDWQNRDMGKIFWPLVYDQLWMMGPAPDYKAMPGLATRWETTDYKTWRFHINSSARFSDQVAVSLKDIIFSLNLFTKKSDAWNIRDVAIQSYKSLDDKILEITLRSPHSGHYPPFYRMPILPRHVWKKYQRNPSTNRNRQAIGSGPYILKEFKPGEVLRLVKNSHYHNKTAKFDELVFLIFPNHKTLSSALKSGLVDLFGYDGIDPSLIREFESSSGVKTVVTDGMKLHWLSFNLSKNAAIRDIKVRKALMSAIDKKQIVRQVFGGYAKEINSFIYPELTGYNQNLTKIPFDLKQATAILNDAGYKDLDGDGIRETPNSHQDLSFSLLVSNTDRSQVKIAEFIRRQVARLGIRINLMRVDSFVYNNFMHNPVESEHDIALNSGAPGPYQDWIWNMMKSDEDLYNQANHANYINYAFDRIFEKLKSAANQKRRFKYLKLAQEILVDDLPYGMLVRPYKICPVRKDKIGDIVVSMGGISSEINLWNYLNLNVNN